MKMYRPHRLCPRNSKPKEPSLYRSLCVSILCMFLSTVMLVGTTFAWFHSSATSAVSTITAGGLNVTTSYITQNTVLAHPTEVTNSGANEVADPYGPIDSLGWVPFSGNGGNPFGSIPFTDDNPSQIIFLKVVNKSSLRTVYRLSLNLLSTEPPAGNLYYGYEVLGSSVSIESLCGFSIPTANEDIYSSDEHTGTPAEANGGASDKVTADNQFYADSLSAHGFSTDKNAYGGNLCVVDLPVGSTKYIAVALYMSGNSSESTDSSSFLVQLSMTVNQLGATDPLMPNRIEQGTPAASSAKLFTMDVESEEAADEEVIPAEESPAEEPPATETPTTSDNGTTDQPAPGGTGTPASPDPSSGPTGEAGTSESGDTGDTGTDTGTPAAGSESEPVPTT